MGAVHRSLLALQPLGNSCFSTLQPGITAASAAPRKGMGSLPWAQTWFVDSTALWLSARTRSISLFSYKIWPHFFLA